MAQPIHRVSRLLLERVHVEIDRVDHRARVEGGQVLVDGALVDPNWAHVVGADEVTVTLGAKVPSLLADLAGADRDCLVAGGVIVAALLGHPRKDPRGQPISFVWTDHIALASSGRASKAMDHSWVRDPQAEHVRSLSGRVRLRGC